LWSIFLAKSRFKREVKGKGDSPLRITLSKEQRKGEKRQQSGGVITTMISTKGIDLSLLTKFKKLGIAFLSDAPFIWVLEKAPPRALCKVESRLDSPRELFSTWRGDYDRPCARMKKHRRNPANGTAPPKSSVP